MINPVTAISHQLQLRIRSCGFAPDLAEICGGGAASQVEESLRLGGRAARWLALVARLPARDAPKVAELIQSRWGTSAEFLTLREIRDAARAQQDH